MATTQHGALAAYASRLLTQSFHTARGDNDDVALFVGDSQDDMAPRSSTTSADEGGIMAYRDDDDTLDPFHTGESQRSPVASTSKLVDDPFDPASTPIEERDRPGWRLHQTTTSFQRPPSPPQSPPAEIRIAPADSWIPRPTRFGFRILPTEEKAAATPSTTTPKTVYVYPAPSRNAIRGDVHRDAPWLIAWVFALLFVAASGIWAALQAVPSSVPNHIGSSAIALLSSLPLLTLFVLLSLLAGGSAMAYLLLVRQSVRLLITGAMVAAPTLLLLTAAWSWGGSWSGYGDVQGETDDERGHLRWFSFGCVVLAGVVAKVTYDRRARIHRTVEVIELGAEVLLLHPTLFLFTLAIFSGFLILTVPLLTISARLLLIASTQPSDAATPTLLACFIGFIWLWSLGVVRGVLRLTVAGTVGHWFFCRHEPLAPSPVALVHDSIHRAIGPSIGSACASSLLLAALDTAALCLRKLRAWTRATPTLSILAPVLYAIAPFVAFAHSAVEGMSSFALVYAGVTGEGFWQSARGASRLMVRTGTGRSIDYVLLKLLLNLVSLALALLFGLIGYLSSHSASTSSEGPKHVHHATLVAVVCFAVPFWTVRCCSDLLAHAVDAVFICWSIDIDQGANHCTAAAKAFGEPVGQELPS